MSHQPFRAVTLDAGNTLLYCDPPPPVIYARQLSRYGPVVGPEEVEPVFHEAWTQMQQATPPGGRDRYSCYPGGERAWWGAFVRDVVRRLDHPAPWRPLLDDLYDAQGVVSQTPNFVILSGGRGSLMQSSRPAEQFVTTLQSRLEAIEAAEAESSQP